MTQAYYLVARAQHAQYDPYTIDDFEVDPLGPPEGDTDEDGLPVNAIGGRRITLSGATAAMVRQPDSRVLRLSLPGRAGAGWEEQFLGQLNADRYRYITLRAQGDLAGLALRVTDASGAQASAPLPPGNAKRWHSVRVGRGSLSGLDWSRLRSLAIVAAQDGTAATVFIDDIAFQVRARSRANEPAGPTRFQAEQIALTASEIPITP